MRTAARYGELWGKRFELGGLMSGGRWRVTRRRDFRIFKFPSNPRNPTYWHARDYVLFALNPFAGNHSTRKQIEPMEGARRPKKIEFRWRLLVSPR